MARIPDAPDEIFNEFTQDLQKTYGDDLISVILYGSGAKDEYIRKKSDINFLIILTEAGIDNLHLSLELIPKWRKRNVAVPLFLTKNYIETALDTFPIEFLDMKKFHRLVYGENILERLAIDKDDLRRQVERELRSKLIYLREGFLSTGHDREQLRQMLSASVPTMTAVFEGLLELKGQEIPKSKARVLEDTAQTFGLDTAVFGNLAKIKNGTWHGSRVQLQELTRAYITQIRRLVVAVDKM